MTELLPFLGSPSSGKTALLLAIIVALFSVHRVECGSKSLYSPSDPILELDSKTFSTAIYGQEKAFIVEFYSQWCGGCKRYAPIWKEFAVIAEPWADIVQVAAVNCARDENTALCREHDVTIYPTIKYFKYKSRRARDGNRYEQALRMHAPELAEKVVSSVVEDWTEQQPSGWPQFKPLTESDTLEELLKTTKEKDAKFLALIVGDGVQKINFGPQVVLGLIRNTNVHTRYSLGPLGTLTRAITQAPGLILYKVTDSTTPVHTIPAALTASAIIIKTLELTAPGFGNQMVDSPTPSIPQGPTTAISIQTIERNRRVQYQNHLTDLLSTLSYICRHEIPLRKTISKEETDALRDFFQLTATAFPGPPPVMRFLQRLNKWLHDTTAPIPIQLWTDKFDELQEDLGHPLPANSTWVACAGSKPEYRGFPCGLWTLFHTLMVWNYPRDRDATNAGAQTIKAVHGYIKHIFGCIECRNHFESGAKRFGDETTLKDPNAVLWLWRLHNRPNFFLKDSPNEDPMFPKQQWPPNNLCQDCRKSFKVKDGKEEIEWDEAAVLRFMLRYYGDVKLPNQESSYKLTSFDGKGGKHEKQDSLNINPKFRVLGSDVSLEERRLRNSRDARQQERRHSRIWGTFGKDSDSSGWFGWTGLDTGICFGMWFASAVVVTAFCLYWKYRRNRSKFWKTFYYSNDYKN